MKRLKLLAIISLALAALLAGLFAAAPSLLGRYLISQIHDACPQCRLELGSVSIAPPERRITLQDVQFHGDQAANTTMDFTLKKLQVRLRPHLRFELDGLDMKLQDDSTKPPGHFDPAGPHWMAGFPAVRVDGIEIRNSRLVYGLKIYGKEALLTVSDIQGSVGPFGTRSNESPRFVDFLVKGRVERSGHVQISAHVDLFSNNNQDQIEIHLERQDLAELNGYFATAEGMTLKGHVERVHSSMRLNRGKLTGELTAAYKDLDLAFKKIPGRGAVRTFLSDIVETFTVVRTRPRPKEPLPVVKFSAQRQGESLVKFLLRGQAGGAKRLISGH